MRVSTSSASFTTRFTTRWRRLRPAWVVTAAVLLWWWYLTLGADLPILLAALAAIAGAVWTVRRRPAIAACAAITVVTAAALVVACVVVADGQNPATADVVAVLTGYLLAAPIPALTACMLRPALVSAPLSTLFGSGILLLSAVPVVAVGSYGLSAAVLVIALVAACAVIYRRHHKAAAELTGALPTLADWTDLGGRRTPDGARIDRLLIGHGHAVACTVMGGQRINDRAALAAARRAAAAAAAIGLPPWRVQPVIIAERHPGPDIPAIRRHPVNDDALAAAVIVASISALPQVTAQVPARRLGQRRAVLTAALLPALPRTEAV